MTPAADLELTQRACLGAGFEGEDRITLARLDEAKGGPGSYGNA